MGKAKKVVVGYRYYMALHMGIGYGPVDALLRIIVGEKTAWSGRVTGSQSIRINAGHLFGGDKAEGGIDGTMVLMMGEPTQTPPGSLVRMLGGRVPGFRKKVTAFYDGLICSMNPYPKKWEFVLERIHKGWDGGTWYPEKATIVMEGHNSSGRLQSFNAMNPAHILYECATNRDWGRGMSRNRIDDAAMRKAADTLFDENFGLCLTWHREDNIDSFIHSVLEHISAVFIPDKTTGLYRIKLLRNDYVLAAMPQFTTDSGILAFKEVSLKTVPEAVNELTLTWRNPLTNQDAPARLHNQASIQSTGALYSDTVKLVGIPTQTLAYQVCMRELKLRSIPLRRFEIECDHTFSRVQPGDVIRVRDVARGVNDMAVRISSTEEGTIDKGGIKLTGVQDLFAQRLSSIGPIVPPAWEPPSQIPELARRRVYEVPYINLRAMLQNGEFAALGKNAGFLGVAGERPTPLTLGYDVKTLNPFAGEETNGPAARTMSRQVMSVSRSPYQFTGDGRGSFAPMGVIETALGFLDEEFDLSFHEMLDEVELGSAVMVNEEIMRVEGILGGKITVARGCADTVPQQHNLGSVAWFYEDDIGGDAVTYMGGERMGVKVLPYTRTGGSYPEPDAPIDALKFNWRFFRPYAPGNVFMGEKRWFESAVLSRDLPTLRFTWAHRDRVLQADKLIEHIQGNIGPEPGQSYVVRVRKDTGFVIREETGIAATEWTYLWAQALRDLGIESEMAGGSFNLTVELYSRRDAMDSWQGYKMRLRVDDAAFYLQAAQLAQQIAQGAEYDVAEGAMAAQLAAQLAQETSYANISGVMTPQFAEAVSQMSAMPTVMDAVCFEAPYTWLLKESLPTEGSRVLAAVARPADRLTDGFDLRTCGVNSDREPNNKWNNAGAGRWTPWVVSEKALKQLDTQVKFKLDSSNDGVPLDIRPGDMALIGDEIVRVDYVGAGVLTIARGCVDTIPTRHSPETPVWFFDRRHGVDTRVYGASAEVVSRVVPHTYSAAYPIERLPNIRTYMNNRPRRPFAPGLVLMGGKHWFEGASTSGKDVHFTWTHRDRLEQGVSAVDHMAGNIGPETDVVYEIWVGYTIRRVSGVYDTVTLRKAVVSGTSWVYKGAWAGVDGMSAGSAMKSCGMVSVSVTLFAKRGGLLSFMGYSMVLTLPSYSCPAGQRPGGGVGDGSVGGGGTQPPTDTPKPPGGGTQPPTDPPKPPKPPGGGWVPPTDPPPPVGPVGPGENPGPDWPIDPPTNPDLPPPPSPEDASGWGEDWDNGWGKNEE